MSRHYDPYYADIARPIAQRVTYQFGAVYEMVLMGLDAEEIEKICNLGAAGELPEYDPYGSNLLPDLRTLSRIYFQAKSEIIFENMQKVFDSMTTFEHKPRKRILSDRDKHNWQNRPEHHKERW